MENQYLSGARQHAAVEKQSELITAGEGDDHQTGELSTLVQCNVDTSRIGKNGLWKPWWNKVFNIDPQRKHIRWGFSVVRSRILSNGTVRADDSIRDHQHLTPQLNARHYDIPYPQIRLKVFKIGEPMKEVAS
jgi:hypothetical protein